VKTAIPGASERRVCRVLRIARSWARHRTPIPARPPVINQELATRVADLIREHPTFGYRRLWAWLRFREGHRVTRRTVYRLCERQGWFVHQRTATPRPRVHGRRSQTARSDERWATDVTHVPCGRDGWAHLAAVIDCHDREVIGYEFALRGRAREAERALEEACLARLGTLRPSGPTPTVRSDNGLIYQSRRFRAACRDYRLRQEFITPYTPEQNGLIERFFRSLKEECVWQHNFPDFTAARRAIGTWIRWYNETRPHQALGYRSPQEFRAHEAIAVAASGSTIGDGAATSACLAESNFTLQQLNPVA
jgi:putative transposase